MQLKCHILCKAFPQRNLSSTSFEPLYSSTITFKFNNFLIFPYFPPDQWLVDKFWILAHMWPSVLVNEVLYYHSHTHLFTYCLWMLLCNSGSIE